VAPVDERGQLDRARPAQVADRVQRGPDRPTGVQDVVDEYDDLAVQPAAGDVRGADRPFRP
jgi:hypothetical protein